MCIVVVVLCVFLSYVYLLYCVGIAFFFTLDAGLLAKSQYWEGVFTFCTCCKIVICLVCIVVSFKLPCV